MKQHVKRWWESIPEKGGLFGALVGALGSASVHRPEDKPLKKAGITAMFTGAGFLLGRWIEKSMFKHRTPDTEH